MAMIKLNGLLAKIFEKFSLTGYQPRCGARAENGSFLSSMAIIIMC